MIYNMVMMVIKVLSLFGMVFSLFTNDYTKMSYFGFLLVYAAISTLTNNIDDYFNEDDIDM